MHYLSLPGIRKPISVLGLGTATAVFTPDTYAQAAALLDAFLAAGGTCIDTAHIYGFGASEKTLGRWLRERGTREQVVLISKACHPVVDPQDLFGKPWLPRVTPNAIRADLSESLARLQTASIDLYCLHRDDETVPVGPVMETLNALQAEGKLGAFGASNWRVARIAAANEYAAQHGLQGFVISSPQFSLARPAKMFFPGTRAATQDDLTWHMQTQFPLLAWSALSAGYLQRAKHRDAGSDPLSGGYATLENRVRLERARELAARKGTSLTQIALAYVLGQAFPVIALAGPTTRQHLDELLPAVDLALRPEELKYLEGN
jgi:aryl-alcohol dehydrogenase-like predicted oxidoreductase